MMNLELLLLLVSSVYIKAEVNISAYHLKPLGSHIPPNNVDEYTEDSMLTPIEFMGNYVLPRKPVVFRGVAKKWPAFLKWSDEYLKEKYPNLELRMEGRKEKQSRIPQGDIALGRDSMKNFIDTYRNKDVNKYIVSELPKPLYKYVNIPSPLGCGELKKRFTEINLWINSGGAKSVLHKDSPNTINCVVNGSKEWKLVEFQHNDLIYQAWEGPQEAGYGGYSLINPEKVDLVRFPNILKIPRWYYTHIQAGDCLYLPSQMWHVVHSHGEQNLAVAFLLSQFRDRALNDLNLENCGDQVVPKISLDEIDVDWQYPGYGNMTMGYADIVDYMSGIKSFFSAKTKKLSKKRIYREIFEGHDGAAHQKREAKDRSSKLYKLINGMAPDGESFELSMLKSLSRDQLRDIIRLIEPHYPAGTVEYEYSQFLPEDLVEVCHLLASSDGMLTKQSFVTKYLEMNGSLKFAEEFWLNLAGEKDEVRLSDVAENFEKATAKYEFYRTELPDGDEDGEEIRNSIPESNFVSEPRGTMADFVENDATDMTDEESQRIESNEIHPKTEL